MLPSPTGGLPLKKGIPGDEGELIVEISPDHQHGLVVIDFGRSLQWLGLSPHDARRLSAELLHVAEEVNDAN